MTRPNSTEIIVVLDRSGSMVDIKKDMEGGFNALIEEQKKVPGECRVSLYQFDDKYDQVYAGYPIDAVPKLRVVPRGSTALWDAVGRTINATGDRLSRMLEWDRPSKVIFIIITDGQENSSREFNLVGIKSMIEHQEKVYNWAFMYLGSSPTTAMDAVSMGINAYSNYIPNSAGVENMSYVANNALRSYRISADAQPSDLQNILPKDIPAGTVDSTFVGSTTGSTEESNTTSSAR